MKCFSLQLVKEDDTVLWTRQNKIFIWDTYEVDVNNRIKRIHGTDTLRGYYNTLTRNETIYTLDEWDLNPYTGNYLTNPMFFNTGTLANAGTVTVTNVDHDARAITVDTGNHAYHVAEHIAATNEVNEVRARHARGEARRREEQRQEDLRRRQRPEEAWYERFTRNPFR